MAEAAEQRVAGLDRERMHDDWSANQVRQNAQTTGERLNPVKVSQIGKATLINLKLPYQIVAFDFNPKDLKFTKNVRNAGLGSGSLKRGRPLGSSGSIYQGTDRTKISFTALLEGNDVKRRVDQLINWTEPVGGLLDQAVRGASNALAAKTGKKGLRINLTTKLPVLTFQWGPPALAFTITCTIEQCNVTFKRFDRTGIPSRAEATIGLREEPSLLGILPTNPTSGGIPGRESHVVSDGETLMSIATFAYGAPQHWRALAAANGIDDPLRVRPGQVVYLPAASELLDA
jgi:hypothetical protein